jgi:hypothetical protein
MNFMETSLFALMSVFSQFFLAFMGGDFSQFAFSSAGHLTLLSLWNMPAQAALLGLCNS